MLPAFYAFYLLIFPLYAHEKLKPQETNETGQELARLLWSAQITQWPLHCKPEITRRVNCRNCHLGETEKSTPRARFGMRKKPTAWTSRLGSKALQAVCLTVSQPFVDQKCLHVTAYHRKLAETNRKRNGDVICYWRPEMKTKKITRHCGVVSGSVDKEHKRRFQSSKQFCFKMTEVEPMFLLFINFVNTAGMLNSVNHNVISGNYSFPACDNGDQWQCLAVSNRKYFPRMALSWETDYFANASYSFLVISRKIDLLIWIDKY